jgi:hypothetical protein
VVVVIPHNDLLFSRITITTFNTIYIHMRHGERTSSVQNPSPFCAEFCTESMFPYSHISNSRTWSDEFKRYESVVLFTCVMETDKTMSLISVRLMKSSCNLGVYSIFGLNHQKSAKAPPGFQAVEDHHLGAG